MKSSIEKHLIGVYKSLKTKIDYINNSIGHNLTKGEENEIILQQLLTDFLPKGKFDLSSGIILGTQGTVSKQNDIIILSNDHPNYTFSRDSRIHLADHVLATIEIKTTFDRKALVEALKNIEALKRLEVNRRKWSELKTVYEANDIESVKYNTFESSNPLGIIFFYSVREVKSAHDVDSYFQILEEELDKIDWRFRPDLIFNMGNGTRYRFSKFPRTEDSEELGIILLMDSENSMLALNLQGEAITKNTLQLINFNGKDLKVHTEVKAVGIPDEEGKTNVIAVIGDTLERDPLSYPSCQIKGKIYFVDIYRSFIQFMVTVNNLLDAASTNRSWTLGDYLGDQYLRGVGYSKENGIE